MKTPLNIISVSGGKDSTALYCTAVEILGNGFLPIMADTGHEHPVTINYVKNLHIMVGGPPVVMVGADFGRVLEKKGKTPTGKAFADLIQWKGRAPSTKAQFCTEHLKLWPIKFYLEKNYPRDKYDWAMFQGVRRGESKRRATRECVAWNGFFDCIEYLPLCYQSKEWVFDYLKQKGVPPNPLYALGYGRVGCFPCIHANKTELSLLPDWAWDRLKWYESLVGRTWFDPNTVPGKPKGYINSIDEVREWCKTMRGGVKYDLFKQDAPEDAPSCFSSWECE